MPFSKLKFDLGIIVGISLFLAASGGLAYVAGKHITLKEQHSALELKLEELNKQLGELKAEKDGLLQANATNQATITQLTSDIMKSQSLINQTSQRNLALQATITDLRISQAKGTADDGEISVILAETLRSIPGATK